MKLISMTDFVLEKTKMYHEFNLDELCEYFKLTEKYANFLKQPLELWMFVPCKLVDGVWVVLEEPKRWDDYLEYPESFDGNPEWNELYTYQQAKERCLFEGFELGGQTDLSWIFRYKDKFPYFINKQGTVESIIIYNLQLIKTAIKQIGL